MSRRRPVAGLTMADVIEAYELGRAAGWASARQAEEDQTLIARIDARTEWCAITNPDALAAQLEHDERIDPDPVRPWDDTVAQDGPF